MPIIIIQATEPWLGLDWKAIGILVTVFLAALGGMLSLLYKLIVSNFSAHVKLFEEKLKSTADKFQASVYQNSAVDIQRMNHLKEALEHGQEKHDELEKDFRKLLAKLPVDYVHRDDWVRGFNQIDGKIDQFAQNTNARLEAIWEVLSNTRETVAKGK